MVERAVAGPPREAAFGYAWRAERGGVGTGRALQWWLAQLERPATRRALLERHAGVLGQDVRPVSRASRSRSGSRRPSA
jgi:hypothetical protein